MPANLAQWHAALLLLQPTRTLTRQSSVAPAPQLAPAIVPAPVVQYHYLPPPLAQAREALPPLVPLRGRENNTTVPAPLLIAELNAQYATIPRILAPQGRGGGRGRENSTTVSAPLPMV